MIQDDIQNFSPEDTDPIFDDFDFQGRGEWGDLAFRSVGSIDFLMG
jgi:hypothetical protein